MHIPIEQIITLLHEANYGTLATHSQHLPGYPFATALPYAPDWQHRPVFLISRLAEHTKNLQKDARASFLIAKPDNGRVLSGARMTIVGDMQRCEDDEDLVVRYRRYQPDAEQYLALEDFAFYRLEPRQIRMIAGFGKMGWTDAKNIIEAPQLSLAEEAKLMIELSGELSPGVKLLGIDCFGLDLDIDQKRERQKFHESPIAIADMTESARRLVRNIG